MTVSAGFEADIAALKWQMELGADEAIGEAPINRYEVEIARPAVVDAPARAQADPSENAAATDAVLAAESLASAASDLVSLRAALDAYEHCDLKKGARQLVFADGNPDARVMIVGEAPGRDEDRLGKPFVGRAGQLLDKMFAAIGLSRDDNLAENSIYIANVLPWRPPQNREPTPEEIAMMVPFLARHIALAAPDILVVMGNTPCQALLGKRGITRLRGTWGAVNELPCMPMFHPAALLRDPLKKRDSWADLQAIRARLDTSV